ncbi:MAG: hypothetical protein HC925_03765 [Coleofasciculaceae cyanobacterium SM2_3_26]|nr:hypothetical protein [Coleofasciculaceae cyanobacterium SM2_3_26]
MQLIVANLRAETANVLDFSTPDLSEADFFDTCDRTAVLLPWVPTALLRHRYSI